MHMLQDRHIDWFRYITTLQDQGYSWNDAYGKFLGTNMVCSFATTIVSFFPKSWLRRLFPTWIAGLTVFLVGVNLIGVAGISVRALLS